MAQNNSVLTDILDELKELRKELRSSNNRRISSSERTAASATKTADLPPARKLLHDIANRPKQVGICWYHRQHGIATITSNCPGPSGCSFNMAQEVEKMKKLIKLHSPSPVQSRLKNNGPPTKAPINDATIRTKTRPQLATMKKPEPERTSVSIDLQPVSGHHLPLDWSEELPEKMETSENMSKELEEDLLLSDSE